jgi:hypothetical protein
MSSVASDSIPNAEERKEKEGENERKKRRKKRRRREVQTHGWKKEEGRRNVDPPRLMAGSRRPWVEPVAGHTQAGDGFRVVGDGNKIPKRVNLPL